MSRVKLTGCFDCVGAGSSCFGGAPQQTFTAGSESTTATKSVWICVGFRIRAKVEIAFVVILKTRIVWKVPLVFTVQVDVAITSNALAS
jgi:hypothetical protein